MTQAKSLDLEHCESLSSSNPTKILPTSSKQKATVTSNKCIFAVQLLDGSSTLRELDLKLKEDSNLVFNNFQDQFRSLLVESALDKTVARLATKFIVGTA